MDEEQKFEISQEEQTRRFSDRMNDPRKIWKLSPMDVESHRRRYDYSRARDMMFAAALQPGAANQSPPIQAPDCPLC
jgi:polyphosphate kinase 2 (PPK2 family)